MKKVLLFLFFIISVFVANSQTLRPTQLPTTNAAGRFDITGYQMDSAFLYVLRDSFPAKYPSVIYHPNGNLYKTTGGAGAHWSLVTDTTWLSNRIDLKLNIADTAAMLSNYLRKTDTANLVAPYMKYSDTSNMLTPYHQSFYTATFDTATRILTMYPITGTVPTILSIPRGGSITGISSLTPYRVPGSDVQYLVADNGDAPGFTLKTADSATIMHFSDTATMLSPYAHSQAVVKYYDTSAMLSKYVRYTDTANIVANRLKISDTATMLSNRLKISDTANMLAGYKTYYPRTAISGGSGITYDPVTGIISNGSPSSGGTVTSVSAGVGMNFTTITTTGPVNADTLVLATRLHVDSIAMRKLNLADTAAMLSNRLKISDTAIMLRNHATYAETLTGKNISGSANNLSNIANSSLVNSTISGIPLGSNLAALTNGFGITSLSYNGSTAKAVTVDTSSGGVATWALLKKKIDSVSATGGGSVISVGLVLPTDVFTVTGSPVTTSGNLTGTFKTQTANKVFASDTSGSPAQPTFRALVAADLPDTYLPISDTAAMLSNYTKTTSGTVNYIPKYVGTHSLGISSIQLAFTDPFYRQFAGTNTTDRIYTFPDAAGTIALTSDISDSIFWSKLYNTITTKTIGDTLKLSGKLIFDSTFPAPTVQGNLVYRNSMQFNPLVSGQNSQPFFFSQGASKDSAGINENLNFGWNLGGNGQKIVSTNGAIGWSFEQHYRPDLVQSLREAHLLSISPLGSPIRLESYVINDTTGSISMYHTTSSFDLRKVSNGANYYSIDSSGKATQSGSFTAGGYGYFTENNQNIALSVDGVGTSPSFGFNRNGVNKQYIQSNATTGWNFVQSEALPIIFSSNGGTALTLDASQNTTTGAKLKISTIPNGSTSDSLLTVNNTEVGKISSLTFLKVSDTSSMLSNRLKISDTLTMLSGYGRKGFSVQYIDTAAMLSKYGNMYRVNTWAQPQTISSDVQNVLQTINATGTNSPTLGFQVGGSYKSAIQNDYTTNDLKFLVNGLVTVGLKLDGTTGDATFINKIIKSGGTSSQALIADGSVLTLTNGTYTPTISNTSNVASSSASEFQYMRVGNTVTVSGSVTATATSGVSTIALEITLPIASTFTQNYQCAGTGAGASGLGAANTLMVVNADTSTHLAYCQVFPGGTASTQYWLHFTYQIL